MAIENIEVKPMYVYIGKDIAQVEKITCVADVASSLNSKYFLFHSSAGVKHYAWFDVNSAGTDPAPAGGWTGHEVDIAVGATASQVATALAAVLTAVTGFDAAASSGVVTLTHTAIGYAQPAIDSVAAPTGFAFKVTTLGMEELSAGCLQGEIELTGFEQTKIEITCHSSGSTIKDERITGYAKPELAFTLQETDKQSLQNILVYYGMPVFTPVGADKEAVFGYGPANVGGSNPKVYIRMHPVSLDASDKSQDWNIWTAELGLDTFNFSGENVSVIPSTWSIFPDETKPEGIQFFMIGDAAKAGY
jgi:hypothetical protein